MEKGIGDWGLGIGDWANPQSPIPNPQSPIPIIDLRENSYNILKNILKIYYFFILFFKFEKINLFFKIYY
jgi:hypothetical protein